MVGKVGTLSHKLNYFLINITFCMIFFYIGFTNLHLLMKIFLNILSIFLPFFIGFLLAYAVYPIVSYFVYKKLPKWLSILIVLVSLVLFFLMLILVIFPIFYHQILAFSIEIIRLVRYLEERFSFYDFSLENLLSPLLQFVSSFSIVTISNVIGFLTKCVVSIVSFIYFLLYMDKIRYFFRTVVSKKYHQLYLYLEALDTSFLQYMKGIGKMIFIQFVEYSSVFFLIGHPYFLILGILTGVFTIVPYIGGLLASLIAILTAFMISKNLFIMTIILCILFPFIDEYLLSPYIYGKASHIHPVLSLFLLSIGGSIGGVLGIILVIPLYLFFRVTLTFFGKTAKDVVISFRNVI